MKKGCGILEKNAGLKNKGAIRVNMKGSIDPMKKVEEGYGRKDVATCGRGCTS
jgi:hypothetical protein